MIKIYSRSETGKMDSFYAKAANYEVCQDTALLWNAPYEAVFSMYKISDGTKVTRSTLDLMSDDLARGAATGFKVDIAIYETLVGNLKVICQVSCNGTVREISYELGDLAATGAALKRCPVLYSRKVLNFANLTAGYSYTLMNFSGTKIYINFDSLNVWINATISAVPTQAYDLFDVDCDILYYVASDAGSGSEAETALTRANYAVNKANQADEKASRLEKIDVNGLISI